MSQPAVELQIHVEFPTTALTPYTPYSLAGEANVRGVLASTCAIFVTRNRNSKGLNPMLPAAAEDFAALVFDTEHVRGLAIDGA